MKFPSTFKSCLLLICVWAVDAADKKPPKSAFFGQSFNRGFNSGYNTFNNQGGGYGNQGGGYGNQGGGYGNQGQGYGNQGGYNNNNNNQRGNTGYGIMHGNRAFCPNQTLYDNIYLLSGIAVGYPVQDITNELVSRPDLAGCLARTATLDTAPQIPLIDSSLGHVKETCPSVLSRVYSYTDNTAGVNGRCWILQNFQEPVNFATCLTHYCRRCGSSNQFNANIQNRCIKTYRYVGIYAYCENLVLNSRIVYQRIIIPDNCSCKSVYCYPDWH